MYLKLEDQLHFDGQGFEAVLRLENGNSSNYKEYQSDSKRL